MHTFFYNLTPVATGAVAVVLVLGLWNMLRRGSPNLSQQLMRWRVGLPVLALEIPHLLGFYGPGDGSFRLAVKLSAGIGLVFTILQFWRHRLRIAVTDRRILVRRGYSWRRHAAMDLHDISGFNYNLKSQMLLFYGNRRVLEIRCGLKTRARIIVAVADAV